MANHTELLIRLHVQIPPGYNISVMRSQDLIEAIERGQQDLEQSFGRRTSRARPVPPGAAKGVEPTKSTQPEDKSFSWQWILIGVLAAVIAIVAGIIAVLW